MACQRFISLAPASRVETRVSLERRPRPAPMIAADQSLPDLGVPARVQAAGSELLASPPAGGFTAYGCSTKLVEPRQLENRSS